MYDFRPHTTIVRFPAQFTIDASPSYMLKEDTIANIASMLPHVKIIVTLREPVERMMSE